MTIYAGVNDLAQKIDKVYASAEGENKLIHRAYAGVNGVARLVYEFRILPDAYQQVEYIQSDGTQYINTGVYVNSTAQLFVDYEIQNKISNVVQGVAGLQGATESNRFFVTMGSSNGNSLGLGNGYATTGTAIIEEGGVVIQKFRQTAFIDAPGKKVYSNNVSVPPEKSAYSYFTNNAVAIEIFSMYNAISKVQRPSATKIFSAKIYKGGGIVRDYYPCYRKSDSEPGLYDIVNDVFYADNASSATKFVIGPDYFGIL